VKSMRREDTQLVPLSPYASLLLRKGAERVLVVSDLHIGWEVALAEKGIHVPSQTEKIIKRLEGIISSEKPDCLVILGDVKHTIAKIEVEEWRDVPRFFEEVCKMTPKVQVIPGNHDGNIEALLPEDVEVLPSHGIAFGEVGLFHGHAWPDPKMMSCSILVVGHVHPVVVFRDPTGFRITRQVWVRAPCDGAVLARSTLRRYNVRLKRDENPQSVLKARFNVDLKVSNLIIMPSFNDFLGGQAVNRSSITRERRFREFIGPVLRSGGVNLEKAEIYLLDGTFLGSLSHLRALI